MAKYLIEASYTAEGLKGLVKDKASGRKTAVSGVIKKAGGKLEAMYYSLGEYDVVLIADMPDNASVAAISAAVGATGAVRLKSTALLTIEEMDEALSKPVAYRAPGT